MGWKDIKPGKYLAKATRIRMGESSQKGTPFIEVEFKLNDIDEHVRWKGYLSEKTLERTMEVLAFLEYNDDDLFRPGCINQGKDAQLVIELEPEIKDATKEYPKVQWVNDPAKEVKFEGLDPAQMKAKLGGINLKAEMMAARQRLGLKTPVKNMAPQATAAKPNVPF
jgi:hypothetical protein